MEIATHKYPSENDFQKLFESAPGLYLVLTPEFRIVAVSDNYARATMTERSAIVGKGLFEVFPGNPDDSSGDGVSNLQHSLNTVLSNKAPHTMAIQKYDIRNPDGAFEERYWSPVNSPVLDENNGVIFIIHRVEDVTAFMKLKEQLESSDQLSSDLKEQSGRLEIELYKRAQEIQKLNGELEVMVLERTMQLETLNKAIVDYKFALDESSIVAITDQKGIIKGVNENFCRISKYSRQELIGQDHRIINSGYHSKEFIRGIWKTIANGRIWKGEIKNRAKDGTIYWVDTTIVPFLDDKDKPYQYLAIRSDITQRKAAEEEILRLNEELEKKVTERTLQLTHSLEREKGLNEMKSRFVSIASHEFRTPLSTILSSISLLKRYTGSDDSEKRDKHIAKIEHSVKNLTDILGDFLSLDKMEQGKTEVCLESFNLCDFTHEIRNDVDGLLKEGQVITIEHSGNMEVMLDKKILKNIMLNLLSNAIKYSPENRKIELIEQVQGSKVRIRVRDQGIGIPEEEQKNLFNNFFRTKNASHIQGTGLGLTIVKKYVELMNGSIGIISGINKGTTIQVEFLAA